MKNAIRILLALLFLASVLSLDAEDKGSAIFYKTVPVMKVYSHPLGYKVVYLKNNLDLGELYLPIQWFETAGGKGELVWGSDRSYPYLSIFWKDGKFNHVRLYLSDDLSNPSWGRLTGGQEVQGKFQVDTFEIEF